MRKSFNRLSSVVAAVVCAALFLLSGGQVRAAGSQVLHGHVPAVVAGGLQSLRHLETNHLRLAIGLPLRDKEGLTNLLQQIYDPASPNYHHYLTPAQFAKRFGPTPVDYETLQAFATAHNLTVTRTHPSRTLLDVEGSVADIEKALHIKMQVYRHPTEQRDFYAPDREPSVDLNLPILHISGLDNYVVPHPLFYKKPAGKALSEPLGGGTNNSPLAGSGPGGNYFGFDFRNAYVPGVTLNGAGQNAALFEYDGYFANDITSYEQQAGLPNVTLVNVPIDGGVGIVNPNDPGVVEVSLDIEMVIAMAPGISTIFVYESPEGPADDILIQMAEDDLANQISSSWGYSTDPTTDQIFQIFAVQGQSFYQASGDSDAYVGLISTPEDNPFITLVGGTELVMNGIGVSYGSEMVWNEGYQPANGGGAPQFNNYVGSGGGISTVRLIPSWQQGISMTNNGGSTKFRNLPDVALTADNIYVIYGDGQTLLGVGGTSCAAPLWCGFTALVNQQAAANGDSTAGFINPAVYAIGNGLSYSNCFHDIVVGSNTWPGSPTNFFAVPGYDLCTGLGTPNGSNLINALAPPPMPILAVVTNIISGGSSNGIIGNDGCYSLTTVLTNEGGAAATGVEATLFSTTPEAIVAQGTAAYPVLLRHGSAPNVTPFTISTEPTFVCGTPINLVMVLKCNQLVQTNYIQLPSGFVGPPVGFTNTTALSIPTTGTPVNSPIVVSGLPAVGKITVSVFMSALYDFAMSLELISPDGTSVILSQFNGDNGPTYANFGVGCGTGLETTFDDAATNSIFNGSPPFLGSYQPEQPLSTYYLTSGTNLNGTWNLQIVDDFSIDTAVLECWSLNISPEVCLDGGGQCPGADLSLTMSASPNPVYINSNLVYTMTVSNAGPSTANNVLITQLLPPGLIFDTASNYPVTASQTGSNLNLNLGALSVYASATVYVVTTVTPNTTPGLNTSTAVVGSSVTDPNLNNNSASASVLVTEPLADLAVSMMGAPAAVLEGGLLTYTINVTNNGPFIAYSVTNVTTLPGNANFISATASQQGTILVNGPNEVVVTWNNLGQGTNAVVTIVIDPTLTGNITASTEVFLDSFEVDPNTFNNNASVSTTVGPAADLSITAFMVPNPSVAGTNVDYIVTVSNAGPSVATGVVFSQSLPAQSTYVTNNLPGSTVISNGLINITVTNSLAAGGSVLITNVIKSPTLLFGVKSNSLISTLSVFGQPGDPNPNNNTLTLTNVEEPPTITIVAAGATVTSASVVTNGSIGTNGTYSVEFFLQNVGNIPTINLVATLQTNGGVMPAGGSNTFDYGILAPEAAPTNGQYSFTVSGTNGGTISAVLQLQDGATNLGMATFTFVMPLVQTFSNTNVIFIPDPTNTLGLTNSYEVGQGYPYPSTIMVSNVNGDVSSVTVTVSNLAHSFASDVGLLLVGPSNALNTNGANCVLMSAAGQWTEISAPVVLTFSQSAASYLPEEFEQIGSGTYLPSDYYTSYYGTTEAYTNSSVPLGPYNTNLSVYDSFPANGTWRLYAYDFANGDSGEIYNGWNLAFTTITPINLADLAVTMSSSPSSLYWGGTITNVWTVTNNGPDASAAVVTNILSPGLTLISSIVPLGVTIIQSGQTNFYYLGSLTNGGNVVVTNVLSTTNATNSLQIDTLTVGSSVLDTNLINNTVSAVATLIPTPVDLVVGVMSSPNTNSPVAITSNLVYTLSVANNGPSNAFNVVGSFTLSGLQFDSASSSPSGAGFASNNGVVQCNLGVIPAGSSASVTITNTATSTGVVTNVWSVTTSSTNSNSANNSVSIIVKVTNAVPVIDIALVTLLSQSQNGAIYSNQTNTVSLTLTNVGWASTTTNFVATLQTNAGVVPITTSKVKYGAIPVGASASNPFTFVSSGSPGAAIMAVWSLQDGTNFLGTVTNTFLVPTTMSFANAGAIIIPDYGAGQPYPSEIQVSGPTNLLVSKVTATLNGFSHSFAHDVEVALVSPAGQEVVLMASTGGTYGASGLVLTFDDAATQELPANTNLSSGTFLTSVYSPFTPFPNLAPVPATSTNLAFLNGLSPNGIWSLYVFDDTQGNNGVIANGWSLNLSLVSPVNPAARLVVSTTETPNPVLGGNYITNQVTVNNLGPDAATGVVLTSTLTSSGGTVGPTNLSLGTINAGMSTNVSFQVQTITGSRGYLTNTAVATTASADLYLPDSTNILTNTQVIFDAIFEPIPSMVGGALKLTVNGYPSQIYVIQATTNMASTNSWTNIYTNTGIFSYTNTSPNHGPPRFYRVLHEPQ